MNTSYNRHTVAHFFVIQLTKRDKEVNKQKRNYGPSKS